MTKTELMAVQHLAINEEVEGKFHHVHVEDGYMLTSWNEGDDIKDYQGFDCAYMPIADEYIDFHPITKEEHERLQALCDAANKDVEPNE